MAIEFNFKTPEQSEEMSDIIYCLKNILSIPAGSIPLSRGLGLDWTNLSFVPEDLEDDYAVDLMEKVEEWEPRILVTEVEFNHTEGSTAVDVTVEFASDEEDEEEDDEEDNEEDE